MAVINVDANELTKIDLKLDTSGAYFECGYCKNLFCVGNADEFDGSVREYIENKLIAGEIDEKGELETALFCTCPICFKKCKVDLNLKLVGVKQTMLFKSKVVKRYKFM